MNPMNLLQLKPAWDQFRSNHPKLIQFIKASAREDVMDEGTLIEINDKHQHLTVDEIRIAVKYDVQFVIGSDAHVPEKVGSFEGPLARALEAGLDPARIVNIEKS